MKSCFLRIATMRYVHKATHICVFTAFSECPQNVLILRCCLIHLKKSSICHRCLYRSAIDDAETEKLLVRKTYTRPVSLSRYLIRRNEPRYFSFVFCPLKKTA